MSFESFQQKPKKEMEDSRPKADERVAIELPDLSEKIAVPGETISTKYFTLEDEGVTIHENEARRIATSEEQIEISRQKAGAEPSAGMPRFQFGEPSASTVEKNPPQGGDGGFAQKAASSESAEELKKLKRNLLVKNGIGFQLIHHSGNTTGNGETGEDYYVHPDMQGEKFSKEEIEAAQIAKRTEKAESGSKPVAATPEKITVAVPAEPLNPENPNWDYRIPGFQGIKPKDVGALLNGPDELGFSMLLESMHDTAGVEIKRKMYKNEALTLEEAKMMNYARYEYTRRLKQVEYVHGKLNVADLDVAGRQNLDFAALVQLRGNARTLEVFKKQVLEMAMKNREAFETLLYTYENLTRLREDAVYQGWEKEVQDLCARRGITMDEYDIAYRTGTPEQRLETQRKIQQEITHGWTPFQRTVDSITGGSSRRADTEVRRAESVQDAIRNNRTVAGVHKEMDSLVNILKFTMVDNVDTRRLLQQEAVRNMNLPTPAESGPRSYGEAQRVEAQTSTDIKADFDKVVQNFKTKNNRDWDHATKDERMEGLAPLRDARAEKERRLGQGWFARALSAIARAAFGEQEEQIINKPTLA